VFHEIASMAKRQFRPALLIFILLTILTGILYPVLVTVIAQLVFPAQANGSLIEENGTVVGSALIGQSFTSPKYFWGRPSATSPEPYNASSSSGSNLGPSNPALLDAVKARVDALHAADPTNTLPVPVDLVTASASGLDPDISVANAMLQAPRVAAVRGLSEEELRSLIEEHITSRDLGVFGEPRVNVLELNLALESGTRQRIGAFHSNIMLSRWLAVVTAARFLHGFCLDVPLWLGGRPNRRPSAFAARPLEDEIDASQRLNDAGCHHFAAQRRAYAR
jgi:K+-transporting ATPase KdpC subunit